MSKPNEATVVQKGKGSKKTTPAESSENDMVHVSEGYAPSRATCDTCSHMCEQHKAIEETNMLLKKENDDLTEKYMRMAMSHDVTCLIQEHMQKNKKAISGLEERIAGLEQKIELLQRENGNLQIQLEQQTAKEDVRNNQLLMAKEKELSGVKANLCAMEDLMGLQMKKMYTHLETVTAELEAAKEEIAVKVAQVKQYQKQVEAYKQQCQSGAVVTSPAITLDQGPTCLPHQMLEMKQTPHDGVMTQRSGLGTTPAQNVISQLLTCEADGARQEDDSDDGLPPPIPLHQMHHHAYGAPVLPLSQPKALQCTVPSSDKLQHVGGGLDGGTSCIGDDIKEGNDRRGFVDTDSPAPLDQNLKCPLCGKVFKKGRIQNFRLHVQTCGT